MTPETAYIPSMCILPQFQVGDEMKCNIKGICPLQDSVCVTYENPADAHAQRILSHVAVFTTGAKKITEQRVYERGQLKMLHLSLEKLLVYFPKDPVH